MRFFRWENKKQDMVEKKTAEKEWPDELASNDAASGIRFNDRRRFNAESDAGEGTEPEASDEPRLKPSYVEELEARTLAAEQKAADVQARFEQLRAELKRETDEAAPTARRALLKSASQERRRRLSPRSCPS